MSYISVYYLSSLFYPLVLIRFQIFFCSNTQVPISPLILYPCNTKFTFHPAYFISFSGDLPSTIFSPFFSFLFLILSIYVYIVIWVRSLNSLRMQQQQKQTFLSMYIYICIVIEEKYRTNPQRQNSPLGILLNSFIRELTWLGTCTYIPFLFLDLSKLILLGLSWRR